MSVRPALNGVALTRRAMLSVAQRLLGALREAGCIAEPVGALARNDLSAASVEIAVIPPEMTPDLFGGFVTDDAVTPAMQRIGITVTRSAHVRTVGTLEMDRGDGQRICVPASIYGLPPSANWAMFLLARIGPHDLVSYLSKRLGTVASIEARGPHFLTPSLATDGRWEPQSADDVFARADLSPLAPHERGRWQQAWRPHGSAEPMRRAA